MSTQILSEIKLLSLADKVNLMEFLFKAIKEESINFENESKQREIATETLLSDYQKDNEMSAFTSLDSEDIYESR